MADITDERLREIATSDPIAAELLAARARIKSLEGCLVRNMEAAIRRIPKAGAARCDPVMVALAQASQERDAARAEVERLRDMLARLCGAVEHSAPRYGVDEDWVDDWVDDWADIDTLRLRLDEAKALLAKHKETDQ